MFDGFLLLRYTFARNTRVEKPTTFPAVAKINKVLVLGDLFAPESCEIGLFTRRVQTHNYSIN